MDTEILKPQKSVYDICAKIIRDGGMVAFPTETVYGLGADAANGEAVKKIFEAKGRPSDNPVIVHIADKNDIYGIAQTVTPLAEILMENFMPGPVTLVLKKKPCISEIVSAGLDTVGIRLPANPVAREFIRACKTPVAAPSANTSTRPSPTRAIDVYEDMKGKIPVIIDGGDCDIGIESTVVDATGEIPVILRPGKITLEDIIKVCGWARVSESLASDKVRSPGVKYRHYAPRCEAVLIEGSPAFFEKAYGGYILQGKNPVILCYNDTAAGLGKNIKTLSLGDSDEQAAARLFGLLRAGEKQADIIIIEAAKKGGFGDSLMNRMKKSAGGNFIRESKP